MLTAIVIILFTLTAVLDWLPDVKNRPKKETAVYGLLWTGALAVLLIYSMGLQIPSPSSAIRSTVSAIFLPK